MFGTATVETFAHSVLGGSAGARYELFWRPQGLSNDWASLGNQTGATQVGAGDTGPVDVEWSLRKIGEQTASIELLLDPVSTGDLNGHVSHRCISIKNLTVRATVLELPHSPPPLPRSPKRPSPPPPPSARAPRRPATARALQPP